MYPRFVRSRVEQALDDTRVVLLAGPRQAGKTTLAKVIAQSDRPYATLDNATTLAAAQSDPTGFIRGMDRAIIDEVQRSPALLLAIKESVDIDPRAGRFLLTGSANLMALPTIADSLAGRMEVIDLLPLAQAEMAVQARPSRLFESLFAGRAPALSELLTGERLLEAVLAGGYPEALTRKTWGRRQDWYLNYVDALMKRDVREVAAIEQLDQMPRLLRALAVRAGQLVNYVDAGSAIGLNSVTTKKYAGILEHIFLIRTLPPWHNSQLPRLIRSPKLHFVDAGLLAALLNITPDVALRERVRFGPVLESFVVSEAMKIAGWSDERLEFSHYRDKDQAEADLVIEDRNGRVAAIEVKASATVIGSDFKGIRRLAEAVGDRFAGGYVLYDGDQVVPFGERLWAVPLSCLWG